MRLFRACIILIMVLAGVVTLLQQARAVPLFAARSASSCQRCHHPFPRLAPAGKAFAGNGYRRHSSQAPQDTVRTGDDLLVLGRTLPLSMRLEANVAWHGGDGITPMTDFQTPYALKVISSAPLSQNLSYYFYFYMFEHGEVGVEDAFVMWNDLGGRPFDVTVGQFQVSDPLFKRELRLEFEDYTIYRARIGATRADLTYDRGVMATWSPSRWEFAAAVVNGTGKREADDGESFDTDAPKNVMARASFEVAPGVRVGGVYFGGWEDGGDVDAHVRAKVLMTGADLTLSRGPFELNGQFLQRVDTNPTFVTGGPEVTTRGGFVEALYTPGFSRWYAYGLWNRIQCDQPVLDPRSGGPVDVMRWQTINAGIGHMLQRNVRVQGEAGYDTEAEAARLMLSLVTSY